ncbi:hypothetical protein BDAP_001115 [Binucleata daphniae]
MKLFAISGGIGTGKSTALKILNKQGYTTINCDKLALKVYEHNQDKIVQAIGPRVLENNKLSKNKLIYHFFTNSEIRKKLEKIIHPCVKYELVKLVCYYFLMNEKIVFVEVPLFFELKLDKYFDTILIDCNLDQQRERLTNRDGNLHIDQKMKAQIDMEEKRKRAKIIIKNDGSIDDLDDKLRNLKVTSTGLYEFLAFFLFIVLFTLHTNRM